MQAAIQLHICPFTNDAVTGAQGLQLNSCTGHEEEITRGRGRARRMCMWHADRAYGQPLGRLLGKLPARNQLQHLSNNQLSKGRDYTQEQQVTSRGKVWLRERERSCVADLGLQLLHSLAI